MICPTQGDAAAASPARSLRVYQDVHAKLTILRLLHQYDTTRSVGLAIAKGRSYVQYSCRTELPKLPRLE